MFLAMFRSEVLAYRSDRLSGDVTIAVPVSWQYIGYGLLASLIVAAAFLSAASYARVETVAGIITPDKGITTIMPSRAGIIMSLNVR